MRKSNKTNNNVYPWELPTHCWDINASRLFRKFGLRPSHVRHWFHTTTYHSTKSSRLIFELERPPLYNSFLFCYFFKMWNSKNSVFLLLRPLVGANFNHPLPLNWYYVSQSCQAITSNHPVSTVFPQTFLIYWLEQHCRSLSVHTPFLISP